LVGEGGEGEGRRANSSYEGKHQIYKKTSNVFKSRGKEGKENMIASTRSGGSQKKKSKRKEERGRKGMGVSRDPVSL